MHPKKNTMEFKQTIPEILEHTPTEEFVIIGNGRDARIIPELQQRFGKRLVHIPGVTRAEALRLISSSSYGYLPAKQGIWGFPLDCWGTGTPLIVTHDDGYVDHMRNAILSNPHDIAQAVNRLLSDPELSSKIIKNGLETFSEHSPKIVAAAVNQLFQQVVSNPTTK
jgi:glycosyltransferase involved in cell wall biosynthesis